MRALAHSMMSRRDSEMVRIRKLAEDLARRRGERVNTAHLLAVLADVPGSAAHLLEERRLDGEGVFRALKGAPQDEGEAVGRVLQRAEEFARRASAHAQPTPLHLLFALCHERQCAAFRAVQAAGVDITRLRTAAMQLAMGLVGPRRTVASPVAGPSSSGAPLALRGPARVPSVPSRGPVVGGSPRAVRSLHRPLVPVARTGPSGAPGAPPLGAPTPEGGRSGKDESPGGPSIHRKQRSVPLPVPPRPAGSPSTPPVRGGANEPQRAPRYGLDPRRFPVVTQVGTNLNVLSEQGKLEPVVGGEKEAVRILDILAKRVGNNPCLVGPSGVGKTSLVRGLAARIVAGASVGSVDQRAIVAVDPSLLMGPSGQRSGFFERLRALRTEALAAEGRIVLFFDGLQRFLSPELGDDLLNEMGSLFAEGRIPIVATCTGEEFRRVQEALPAVARHLVPVEVEEPSRALSAEILGVVAPAFASHHGITYGPEALSVAVEWTQRYIADKVLPEKAIGVLDLAGARARRRGLSAVGRREVAEVVGEVASVPVERLLESDGERMLRIEELLAARVVGHRDVLARIGAVLRRNASGFHAKRPIGTFLLLGPTGVGKTETAKAVAECLFDSPQAMTRIDLSEYAEPHSIARLIGAPPGYVGYEAGGQLTEAVRRRPYQVVLLDEVEKAHRDVLEGFLQVFDEGRLTDGRGRTVDFCNTVIFMTSNLGAEHSVVEDRGPIGFGATRAPRGSSGGRGQGYRDAVVASARRALPPELYNRIDEALAFLPMERADVAEVARRMLAKLGRELEDTRGVRLTYDEAVVEALLEGGGFQPELGARPMRRAIARGVEAPLAELFLGGTVGKGAALHLVVESGQIGVRVLSKPNEAEARRAFRPERDHAVGRGPDR